MQTRRIAASEIQAVLQGLVGLPCWYVSGGATGSTFSVALGAKVPRSIPLRGVGDEFSTHQGEASVYIWCSWRLDGPSESLASSDQDPSLFLPSLRRLIGRTVTAGFVTTKAHDLTLEFGDMVLRVLGDHIPPDPSFDGNWEFTINGNSVNIGPGFKAELEVARP